MVLMHRCYLIVMHVKPLLVQLINFYCTLIRIVACIAQEAKNNLLDDQGLSSYENINDDDYPRISSCFTFL